MFRFLALFCVFLLMGCQSDVPKNPVSEPEKWRDWKRNTKDSYARHDLAILKAADYRYVEQGSEVYIEEIPSGFKFAVEPSEATIMTAKLEPEQLALSLGEDVKTYPFYRLPSDPITLSPTQRLRFNLENISHSEKRVRAIIYDDEAPALSEFKGLSFFPYDEAGIIQAKFKADPEFPRVILDTERGLTKAFRRAGYAVFEIDGASYDMPLYTSQWSQDRITSFFTGFLDETTGHKSYGVGRYVPVEGFGKFPPEIVEIDFNYAYNPYCARSDAYNCPVIDFVIEAPMRYGESFVYDD